MKRNIFSLLCLMLLASACNKMSEEHALQYYANTFAYNAMNTYYLWKDEPEVAREMEDWGARENAIEKVRASRYKDDQWTQLYDDYSPFESQITGSGLTYGLDVKLYYTDAQKIQVEAVVRYTYADSPAHRAGLKRGDEILTIGGETMNAQNLSRVAGQLYTSSSIQIGLADGRIIRMDAAQMYENPVHTVSTIEHNGVLYGYLHFTNFTLDACKDLESAFAQFKADGIQELILDLRYNTGGYVTTSTALASMIAPPEVVSTEEVFNREVYNDILSDESNDATRFAPEITYTSNNTRKEVTVKPLEVNPGIRHLWVLVTDDSASASESLICGLKPYMDVTLVGERTSGKFCGGSLIKAPDWYAVMKKYDAFDNMDYEAARQALSTWGIYVITSRYADCNGVTLSMPDGIPADFTGTDKPYDGHELGDPAESLLAAALRVASGAASGAALGAVKSAPSGPALLPVEKPFRRPGSGVLLH